MVLNSDHSSRRHVLLDDDRMASLRSSHAAFELSDGSPVGPIFGTRMSPSMQGSVSGWDSFRFHAVGSDEAIENACSKDFERIRKLQDRTQRHVARAKSYDEKVAVLRQFEADAWGHITPQIVVMSIMSLGKDAVEYLNALSFLMKEEDWKTPEDGESHLYKSLRDMRRDQGGALLITLAKWDDLDLGDFRSRPRASLPLNPLRPAAPQREVALDASTESLGTPDSEGDHPWGKVTSLRAVRVRGSYMSFPDKVKYNVHWTSLHGIIESDLSDVRDMIYLVRALADCGSESGVYNSVMGRAIQTHAWELVENHFYYCVFTDVALLVGFVAVGLANHRHERPGVIVSVVVSVLAVRSLVMRVLLEPIWTVRLYGRAAIPKLLSPWYIYIAVTDVFTSMVAVAVGIPFFWLMYFMVTTTKVDEFLLPGGNCSAVSENQCFLASNPSLIAYAILLKWLELIVSVLCIRSLGIGLIFAPVLHAASHRESIRFLAVLAMLVFGFWNCYWSFPIQETREAPLFLKFIPLFSLMRVFRLVTLGDFDLMELEGVDEVVQGTVVNGTIDASIDDGEITDMLLHRGVQTFFVLASIMGLVVMNVYIGLLGNLYDNGKDRRHQLHQYLKAQKTYTLLLYFQFLPCNPCSICARRRRRLSIDDEDSTLGTMRPTKGCWIVFDPESFMDQDDMDERIKQLHDKVDELGDSLHRVSSDVGQRLDRLDARLEQQGAAMQGQLKQILEALGRRDAASPNMLARTS